MSSPHSSKTKTLKTKLGQLLRNIISFQNFPNDTSTTKLSNNALGFEKDAAWQVDRLSARSTILESETQTATNNFTISPETRPSSQQQRSFDSEAKVKNFEKLKMGLGVAWNGLETALRLLERSSDTFPPLKSLVSGLFAFLELGRAVTENDKEYERLATELTSIAETLTRHVPALAVDGASGSVTRIVESINTESLHIRQQQDRNKIVRTITGIQDQGDVNQRYRRIESLFRQLQNDVNLRNWDDIRKQRETVLLKEMSPVYEARYNSSYSTTINRRGCTAKTREKVLEDLKGWVEDSKGAKIYWMNGMAGTGKTTISYTLCEWLKKNSQLGGNYFCSRASALCQNVNSIVPTLAHQLAQYSHSFRSALCNILEEEPEACKLDIQYQFEKLIQRPLQVIETAMPDNVVIVIDALDECEDGSAFRLFLDTLLKLAINLPIRFFITSRPEPVIYGKMSMSEYSDSVLYLHDIEESIVGADIRKYLTETLGSMSPAPSSDAVDQLVGSAGKLFIYAATAVRYISPGDSDVNSWARLQTVLGLVSGSTNQYDDLDDLYMNILSTAINPPNRRREEQEKSDILLVLRTVVCAKEPMTMQTLAALLGLTDEQLRFSLQPLRSVLHTREDATELIAPFHSSFPDFLFDKCRSKQFHCEPTSQNESLAKHCFHFIKQQFNTCRLESSFLFEKDAVDPSRRIKGSVSPALSYACQYWGEHFVQGDMTDTVHERLVDFLSNQLQLLFWMEVLHLEQCIVVGGKILGQIRNQLKVRELYPDTMEQLAKAEELIFHLVEGSYMRSKSHQENLAVAHSFMYPPLDL